MGIKERLDEGREKSEAWRPSEAGDELIGEVKKVGSWTSADYPEQGPYPIITVEQENGERLAFHGFHTVAKDQIAEEKPEPGDQIGIRYLGFVDTPQSTYAGYHNYHVVSERPAGWTPPSPEAVAEAREAVQEQAERDDIPF